MFVMDREKLGQMLAMYLAHLCWAVRLTHAAPTLCHKNMSVEGIYHQIHEITEEEHHLN